MMIFLILRRGFNFSGTIPCQILMASYLQQILKTCPKPLSNTSKFCFLYARILCAIQSGGLCEILQKYLSLRISNLHARGSTPQNSRTMAGGVFRGQLISFFRVCVWKCSSSLAKPVTISTWDRLLYLVYVSTCAQYSRIGRTSVMYSLIEVLSRSPSSRKPNFRIVATLVLAF